MGEHMKLATLAVSLLVAAIAAVGSLVSHGSLSGVANDVVVQALSQKMEEQDLKLSKAEEALRQLQDQPLAPHSGLPDKRPAPSSQVTQLRNQFQWLSNEENRLNTQHKHLQQEQERLDTLRYQLELTKYRLDQEEKVLGLEIIAKAVDDRQRSKSVPLQPVSLTSTQPHTSRTVDLHGEMPFEYPQPAVIKPVDYTSLTERQAQLQTERKQWTTDSQAFNQMQTTLNRQMLVYRKDLSVMLRTKKDLDQEWKSLKNQGLAVKAKS